MSYHALFEFLSGDAGAYATPVPAWANALLGYADCCWFAALLGWLLVALLWWWRSRHSAPAGWRWLPWSVAAGLACSIIMLVDFTTARLSGSAREAYLSSDCLIAAATAAGAAGWWWQVGWDARGFVRWASWTLVAATLAFVPWQISFPAPASRTATVATSNVLAVMALLAALPWWWRRPADGWSRAMLALVAILPVFSTVGPLASYVFFMRHKFSPVTTLGVGWGAMQAAVAFLIGSRLLRMEWIKLNAARRSEVWRDAQPMLSGAAASLLLGGLAAWWVGDRQRASAEERALDQARLAVAQLEPEIFVRLTGPEFVLDQIQHSARRYFPPTRIAFSNFLAQGGEHDAKAAFFAVAKANRTMIHLRFITRRGDWLVGTTGYTVSMMGSLADAFGGTSLDPKTPVRRWSTGWALLARRLTADDLAQWRAKAEWLEGPLYTAVFSNPVVFARAPILARDGTMLGWLEFTYLADSLLAGTFQSRIAPFAVATVGVGLMALLFVGRQRSRERATAIRAAAVAVETARARSVLLANVSHELRTPLQSVLGYGELLQQDATGETTQARLAALRQNGELMLRLVNDLLDLSAMEAGGFRIVETPTRLPALVCDTVESLRPRFAAKGLALQVDIATDFPPWVACDGERFRQILLNLAGNAVKFTECGRVDIALRALERRTDDTCMIELTVRDTGPGIAPADQARLFQPFARLDLTARKEGTGLGLALSAALCRNAEGELMVESDGRTGACFRARLRVRISAPPTSTRLAEAFPTLRGRRILIVDDNALVHDLFAAWFADLGAICEVAKDGEQALARAEAGAIDAVILDLAMPRLDGLAVARRWRAEGRTWRIVGVSAHASGGDRAQALAAGMDAFLSKPVDLGALARALAAEPTPTISPDRHERLRAALTKRFRLSAPAEAAAMRDALERRDWTALKRAAHHLKSSAGVVGDDRLYDACTGLEDAADTRDLAAVSTASQRCEAALTPWLARR